MKKLFTLSLVIILTLSAFTQSPEKMSYQCVVRNASGVLLTNQSVGIRISILHETSTGTVVYAETQTPTTNANGLVSIEIGGGIGFDAINWANGPYFLETETDPTGGTNYTIVGTSQLLSVPYALYAKSSGINIPNQMTGDLMYFDGISWVRLPRGTSGQILAMNSSGQPNWVDMFGPPITTTEAATNVRETSVTLNCIINARGLFTTVEFEFGIDISYGSKVSILQNPIISNSPAIQSVNVYGLLDGRTYHFRVKTVNAYGTTYGEDMTFSTISNNGPFSIGKSYGGGIIFYLDNTGQHGLVCATSDQIQGVRWNNGTVILIGTSRLVGTGQANTTAIVNAQGSGIYAASICDQLILNGYTDWFLPSIDELQLIYNQKAVIGGFTGSYEYYWSSSENFAGSVFLWSMVQGGQAWAGTYDIGASVRTIRAF